MESDDEWDRFLVPNEQAHRPNAVPILLEEVKLEQGNDDFCRSILARLNRGEAIQTVEGDDGFLLLHANCERQLCILKMIQERVASISHHGRMSRHPEGRRL